MVWHLRNISGNRNQVKTILAAEKIPTSVKAFIASEIDSLPPNTISIGLDAYCQDVGGNGRKLTRNIQVVLDTFLG